jgi:hypothetical protein
MKPHDIELMQHADGELARDADDLLAAPGARDKIGALGEVRELVRGRLDQIADAVPARRFDAMWTEIDKAIERAGEHPARETPVDERDAGKHGGARRRVSRWFERYRGHVVTGLVSAGAVAALTLWLRGPNDSAPADRGAISVQPAAYRPTEIESLDTPGGTGTVFQLKDEDGATTVIWVTPEDTVEGI